MIQRCTNPNSTQFHDYGGRSITVCEDWLVFDNFLEDMGERPEGMTLDRIDNDGNYEPSNCRWATRFEQMQIHRVLTDKQIRDVLCDSRSQRVIARDYGVSRGVIQRIKNGTLRLL